MEPIRRGRLSRGVSGHDRPPRGSTSGPQGWRWVGDPDLLRLWRECTLGFMPGPRVSPRGSFRRQGVNTVEFLATFCRPVPAPTAWARSHHSPDRRAIPGVAGLDGSRREPFPQATMRAACSTGRDRLAHGDDPEAGAEGGRGAAAGPGVWGLRHGPPCHQGRGGFPTPCVLGMRCPVVESVGEGVSTCAPRDQVVAAFLMP